MKGYRERYRPVPLFTEGYRPAQGYRHVQEGYRDTSLDRGTGLYWRGGGGGGCTGLYSGYRLVQG